MARYTFSVRWGRIRALALVLIALFLCFSFFGSAASEDGGGMSKSVEISDSSKVILFDESESSSETPSESPSPELPAPPGEWRNISLSIGTFSIAPNTNALGAALCSALGTDQCINYTYQSSTTALVTTTEASVIPGIKTPQTVQKTLQLLQYELNVVNRTMGLAHLLNAVLYPSPLLTYDIQSVIVANLSTLYSRPNEPIFSYIGNTSQCLPHFWYLVFFVIAVPLLACGCHYYYLMGKDSARENYAMFTEQVALRAMGPSAVPSANASMVGGFPMGPTVSNPASNAGFPGDGSLQAPLTSVQQFAMQQQALVQQQQQQAWGMSQSVSGMPQSVSGTFQAPQFSPQSPQAMS